MQHKLHRPEDDSNIRSVPCNISFRSQSVILTVKFINTSSEDFEPTEILRVRKTRKENHMPNGRTLSTLGEAASAIDQDFERP